jgi:phosphomannomutase
VNAVIGGEGNGGVILPELHYGRDALVGIALFLSHLAITEKSCSTLRRSYPDYFMAKEKLQLAPEDDPGAVLERMAEVYKDHPMNREDGVKIEFEDEWVHFRRSNTEPIVRIYTESRSMEGARELAERSVNELKEVLESTRRIEN